MKVFVSSLITGHEDLRAAVVAAVRGLGHEVIRAEDFPALASSPQVACLDGVRRSDAVVLILAEHYGAKQRSGKSATHEEFLAARDSRPVFAFVRAGSAAAQEPEQQAFTQEVQAWVNGLFTGSFTNSGDLRDAVTSALHRWEISRARSSVDPAELLSRAVSLLPRKDRHHSHHGLALALAIAGGPRRSILRPAQLEDPARADRLTQLALFGGSKIFKTSSGSEVRLKGSMLEISQERGAALAVDELGGIRVVIPLDAEARPGIHAIVEEAVADAIRKALRFASTVLEEIDETKSLTEIVPVAMILGATYHPWMQRADINDDRSGGMSMRMLNTKVAATQLTPPERSRAALTQELDVLAEDLTTLLRRVYRLEY